MKELQTDIPPGVKDPSRRKISNPVTGEDVEFTIYGHETNGKRTEAIITCQPGGGPPLHYHLDQLERFTALNETGIIQLGNSPPRAMEFGESVEDPPRTLHSFSASDGTAKIKVEVLPASQDFEKSLYILFGLARDGLLGNDGLPKNLVHTAVVGSLGGMFFPGASGMVLNATTSALAFYARMSGEQDQLLRRYWY